MMRYTLLGIWMFCCASALLSQEYVKVRGKVIDAEQGFGLSSMMAVDKKSGSGTFGDGDGEFVLNMPKGDTLLIGAIGYETLSFAIPKDYEGSTLSRTFYLDKLVITLPLVEVIPERELEEIEKDIQKLGYRQQDYQLSGIDAVNSPITFLYQAFSRRERSIRKVAELENEDRKRALLKELFQKYIDYEIIVLEDDAAFDSFIEYCNVSDYFLKNSTQYDFLVYVKKRFQEYQRSPAWIKYRGAGDDEYYRK